MTLSLGRPVGLGAFALTFAVPFALACGGGGEEPAPRPVATASSGSGGAYWGGGGGGGSVSIPNLTSTGMGATSSGGGAGDSLDRAGDLREARIREELARRPHRLTGIPDEAAAYELYQADVEAALAAGEPGDDVCERNWAMQETLLEAQHLRHGAAERNMYMRTCRAGMGRSSCSDTAYFAAHRTECEREYAEGESRTAAFLANLERGDVAEVVDTVSAGRPADDEDHVREESVLPRLELPRRGSDVPLDDPTDEEE